MRELKNCVAAEQPRIHAVLEALTGELPALVRPMAQHILFAGGKRLRPVLCVVFGRLCGLEHEELLRLGASVEMLHAATLLHDDILDNADTRRGTPSAHTVFGAPQAVLAGDALLAKALLTVSALGDARLTCCISEAVMYTAAGEVAEIANVRNFGISQEAYLEIITGKTAWMLRAACELGAMRAGANDAAVAAAVEFGLSLGIAFQIVDDVLDFAPLEQTGKPRGGDIREGKVTPPLLYYLGSLSPAERGAVHTALQQKALPESYVNQLCDAIEQGGHCAAALALSDAYLEKALACLHVFPAGKEKEILQQMTHYVRSRGH